MSRNRKRRYTGKAGYWSLFPAPWWDIGVTTGIEWYPVIREEQYLIARYHRNIVTFRITRKGRAADIRLK
jgi:hypothetical protein